MKCVFNACLIHSRIRVVITNNACLMPVFSQTFSSHSIENVWENACEMPGKMPGIFPVVQSMQTAAEAITPFLAYSAPLGKCKEAHIYGYVVYPVTQGG